MTLCLDVAQPRREDVACAVVADANLLLPDAFADAALRSGFDAALRRHDINRPPMQIARLVYRAIRGCEPPLRLMTLSALIHMGAGLHDDVSDGELTGGRAAQAEALLLSGVCLATLAPFALTTLVEPAAALRALRLLWSGMQTMACGQRRDLALFDDERPDLRAVKAALAKTTGECGMDAALGALVAGVSDDAEIARWEAFGADVGYALQLGSDCRDAADPSGRDIASGARTVPIVFALRDVYGATRARQSAALRGARADGVAGNDARELIKTTRAFAACGTLVEARVARAERRLAALDTCDPADLQTFVAERSWLRKERLAQRPTQAPGARLRQRPDDGVWLLEHDGRYVQLSDAAFAIWRSCDGERTWAQVVARYREGFGVDGTAGILALATLLEERGFFAEASDRMSVYRRWAVTATEAYAVWSLEGAGEKLYAATRSAFHPFAVAAFLALAVAGAVLFITTPHAATTCSRTCCAVRTCAEMELKPCADIGAIPLP